MAQRFREGVATVRARLSLRLVVKLAIVLVAGSLIGVTTEALLRARLGPLEKRIPTGLYTRQTAWGTVSSRAPVLSLGTLGGLPAEYRIPVRLGDLPEHLVQAVLAVEDQRFYTHRGLDVRRIVGALVANLRAGGITQGGSTLTQQLAKNLFLDARRTPIRKLREAALAVVLEARYDKATILEAYLNEIYLGQDRHQAIHGVGAAARYYLGKDVRRLTLAEAALLAGMIPAPNRYAPVRNPARSRERRNLVLTLMAAQDRITPAAAERARRSGLPGRVHPPRILEGRWVTDFLRTRGAVRGRFPARGQALYTTIDPRLQAAAERAVASGLARLRAAGPEAALVALDPRSGEILAMVGGRDYGASQFNRAADALRQPGSAFKPIVALAALERNGNAEPAFTLASQLDDEPLQVSTRAGPWQPANYDGQFRGSVTLRQAMEQSLNVPFARIGLRIGPDRIVATARRLGIASPLRAVPSLALGSSEVTLLELARAYGVLASGGSLATLQAVQGRAAYGDPPPLVPAPEAAQVVDPAAAYLVTSTLEGVIQRGTGRALGQYAAPYGMAGKTGTSNDWRDAWFVAYSPELVVGAWVGHDDGRSLGLTGAGAALPIVARFLADAREQLRGGRPFEIPDGITESFVTLAGGGWFWECGQREYFLEGTEPEERGCLRFELPLWENREDWGGRLGRRALRLLDELLGQAREHQRNR